MADLPACPQDDSYTWSPEQLQMAVGFPPEDLAPEQEEETLQRAESAGSPGTSLTIFFSTTASGLFCSAHALTSAGKSNKHG